MGGTLRRVPLDFAWPLKMTWKGYLNPYNAQKCCCEDGYNPETSRLAEAYWGESGWQHDLTQDEVDALVAKGRLLEFWSKWSPEHGWQPIEPKVTVAAEAVNAASRRSPMVHDGINRAIVIEVRAKRLGVWGLCAMCGGNMYIFQSRRIQRLHNAWKPRNPPRGPGYQLWETTSEGSPVSPVFETLDDLAAWCVDGATTFGAHRATKDEWMRMLGGDAVCHRETLSNGSEMIFV